jgi:type IV pilus assembly protein PilN
MRITLNLATRPFTDLGPPIKRLRIAMGVMAGLSVIMGLGLYLLHHKAEEARARAHSLDGKIAAVTLEKQGYENMMRQPANAQLLVQVAALNQLFDKKTFSWTLAIEDLETVLPGGVQVSTLEPLRDEKTGVISLHLRVIGPRDRAVELVKNLEHSKHFVLPSIIGENAESNGSPGEKLEPVSASNRVNFDLLAQYNPATADELKKAPKPERAEKAEAPAEPAKAKTPPVPHQAAVAKPKPGQVPAAQMNLPQQPGQFAPPRRPNVPYPTMRPGVNGQPGQAPMTGVSRPPQPHRQPTPNGQPNPGGPQ